MYPINYIRDILKNYVDNNVNQFIIYPFGVNGVNVKRVLKEYFNLLPCYVVDNEYSKYNVKIIDKEQMIHMFEPQMYLVLTIENEYDNIEMLSELVEVIPSGNIINLRPKEKKLNSAGFLLEDFLPNRFNRKVMDTGNKVKVRVVHNTPAIWNSIETICQQIENDSLFDLALLGGEGVQYVGKYGYQYVVWDDYSFQEDRPDIVILTNFYEKVPDSKNCRKYTKLIFVIPGFVIKYEETIDKYWETMQQGVRECKPDYYLIDSYLYHDVKEFCNFSTNIVEMGNAKFDGLYKAMQDKEYMVGWEKLRNKMTVLWAESHGVSSGYDMIKQISFDLYAKTIFKYAYDNQDIGIVFRPHPAFVQEMLYHEFWSSNDLQRLKEYCANSPNMVFDDTDTYNSAFSVCDGIITSAFCGIIYSALPTLKPICVCYRSKKDIAYELELVKNYYSVYQDRDIVDYFDMIKEKKDPMFLLRKKVCEKYVKNFDGKNGWRIKEFVKEKWMERFGI